MTITINYFRVIHICIFCESENVKEEIESINIYTIDGGLYIKMYYKYHCLNCNSKWELPEQN
jgi:hypothetical protein